MSAKTYNCSLAGKDVQVNVKTIVYKDEAYNINRPSYELRNCSHIGEGECPVRHAHNGKDDVEGWGYSQTRKCEFLHKVRTTHNKL